MRGRVEARDRLRCQPRAVPAPLIGPTMCCSAPLQGEVCVTQHARKTRDRVSLNRRSRAAMVTIDASVAIPARSCASDDLGPYAEGLASEALTRSETLT